MPASSLAALTVAVVVLAAALTRWLGRPGAPLSVLDHPNERSLHVRPTPRTGGLAVLAAAAAGWTAVALGWGLPRRFAWIAAGALAVAAISFLDDRRAVPVRQRLAVHLAAAAMLIAGGLSIDQVPFPGVEARLGAVAGAAVTVLFVVWMINLYNFMDGMDGFAGGMAMSGFGFLGAALWAAGSSPSAAAAVVIAGAALGFVRDNFPPARIFLGDVGSAPLGYLAAALMLHADRSGALPLWAALLVFSPFITDATVTLLRRLLAGEQIWKAHRTHCYQRVVQLGWGHRRTVLLEYLVMAGCGATALAVLDSPARTQQLALAAWAVFYAAGFAAVGWLERGQRRKRPVDRT